jgi:hypothetical protein
MMRYTVTVYDRAGTAVAREHAAERVDACDLAARLRRRHPGLSVVITDADRDGRVIDEDDDAG